MQHNICHKQQLPCLAQQLSAARPAALQDVLAGRHQLLARLKPFVHSLSMLLCTAGAGGQGWGDKGRFKIEMGLAGVGSGSDTFGLICSASSASPVALNKQRSNRLRLIPTGTPGVFKHIFLTRRTPTLSYLADALNSKLKDLIDDNMSVLPLREVQRRENLTATEVTQMTCGTKRTFGCIIRVEPAGCLSNCKVTRVLLNATAPLNGLRLTVRAPSSVATVPAGSTALATFGDVAALGEKRRTNWLTPCACVTVNSNVQRVWNSSPLYLSNPAHAAHDASVATASKH
jgi:hypothetical protein